MTKCEKHNLQYMLLVRVLSGGYESKHHLIIPKNKSLKKNLQKAWRPSVGQKASDKSATLPYQTRIVHFD
jgi:hypothetical protein